MYYIQRKLGAFISSVFHCSAQNCSFQPNTTADGPQTLKVISDLLLAVKFCKVLFTSMFSQIRKCKRLIKSST